MKKKVFGLAVVICLVLLLTACSAVSDVEEAIEQIGTVSMNSHRQIKNAEQMYDALPADKQMKVANHAVLAAARKEYDRLSAAIDNAGNAIDAIGVVTQNSASAIGRARMAYDALEKDGLTSYVSDKYSILEKAEDQYAQLQYQSAMDLLNQKKYQEAYTLFDAIITDYPGCSVIADVRSGAADSLVGFADKQYNAGALEEAMHALEEVSKEYGTSTSGTELREKIEKALSQQRPQNGKTFTNTVNWGYGEFTVSASSHDACIKLENVTDPSKNILFYVRAGEDATVNVKDGRYIVKYTSGEYWFGQDSMFGKHASFARAEDILEFTTTSTQYTVISITLYTVYNGNLETSEIDPEDF